MCSEIIVDYKAVFLRVILICSVGAGILSGSISFCGIKTHILKACSFNTQDIKVSNDGNYFACYDSREGIVFFGSRTNEGCLVVAKYVHHGVQTVFFSPDGTSVLSTSPPNFEKRSKYPEEGTVKILRFELSNWMDIQKISLNSGGVDTNNGLTVLKRGIVLENGIPVFFKKFELFGYRSSAGAAYLIFHDDIYIVFGGFHNCVSVYNVETKKQFLYDTKNASNELIDGEPGFKCNKEYVFLIECLMSDFKVVACGIKEKKKIVLYKHKNYVSFFKMAKNGNYIATCSERGEIVVYDLRNKEIVFKWTFDTGYTRIKQFYLSDNGKFIVLATNDKRVYVCNLLEHKNNNKSRLNKTSKLDDDRDLNSVLIDIKLKSSISCLHVNQGRQRIFVATKEAVYLFYYDFFAKKGKLLTVLKFGNEDIKFLAETDDGRGLAVANVNNITVFDVEKSIKKGKKSSEEQEDEIEYEGKEELYGSGFGLLGKIDSNSESDSESEYDFSSECESSSECGSDSESFDEELDITIMALRFSSNKREFITEGMYDGFLTADLPSDCYFSNKRYLNSKIVDKDMIIRLQDVKQEKKVEKTMRVNLLPLKKKLEVFKSFLV